MIQVLLSDRTLGKRIIRLYERRESLQQRLKDREANPGQFGQAALEQVMEDLRDAEYELMVLLEEDPVKHFAHLCDDGAKFAADHTSDKTVFVMMKFPDPGEERVKDKILNAIFDMARRHLHDNYGLTAVRADGKTYASSNQLWDNICIYMLGCDYGIAILESKYHDEFNPNVALEYGFMRALGKTVVFFEESGFAHRRADIFGTLSKRFTWTSDAQRLESSIVAALDSWMVDLEIPRIVSHSPSSGSGLYDS